jgi:hypothetical protein
VRQAYLELAVKMLRPLFEAKGSPIPEKLRISVGATSKRYMGICYREVASSDEHREIFLSANLSTAEEILGTLAHELCHAALPDGVAHKAPFVALGKAIGLEGKPSHMRPGAAFKWWIADFVRANGEYPSGSLRETENKNKQATAMIKVECLDCGYVARTTKKWLEGVGAPICPCNMEVMEICE